MSITASSAQQLIQLLRKKVESGHLDEETAEHLAITAIQEIKVSDKESEAADTSDEEPIDPVGEEPVSEPKAKQEKPLVVIDPSAHLLALISQFDQGTAALWNATKEKVEAMLKGVEGAAFPLGDFSSSASTGGKGDKTKFTIAKAEGDGVEVSFAFDRSWSIPGLNPPAQVKAETEATCDLRLRKELFALTEDLLDMTDSEFAWQRSVVPHKSISAMIEASTKENDRRVYTPLKACPSNADRDAWRQWSIAAQVYILGSDYTDKKSSDYTDKKSFSDLVSDLYLQEAE
jgi:hypothetical protein